MAPAALALAVGLLGDLISFLVYLAPLPTFIRIYKGKSTEGFQSVPYIVALFSSMMWVYYAILKGKAYILITINSFGCFIELVYIIIYLIFAPPKARVSTLRLVSLLNLGAFSVILLFTLLMAKGADRLKILGWICTSFAISVFVAPLSIMKRVIRTKSVEFMPFYLSLSLTLSAVVWFAYGWLIKDIFVALPNILGFTFGLAQMVLYLIYRDPKKGSKELRLPECKVIDAKLTPTSSTEAPESDPKPAEEKAKENFPEV